MLKVCSYCQIVLGGEPTPDGAVSHGLCKSCKDTYMPQWLGMTVDQYLESFEVPVVVVNTDSRIIAANPAARALTGKSSDDLGLLGGEFMECVYARRPEQCGNTIHCKSCTIRNTVTAAMTGTPMIRVPAFLNHDDKVIHMIISAQKVEDVMVLLTIEEITKVEEKT